VQAIRILIDIFSSLLVAAEVIFAAELQLESAGGVADTPFVTVKV
jgi:hypothetical protein